MGVTQYIGARYVPIFADPAEWNKTRTYEPLTIVLHEGNSYTSKQFVPLGIDIDDARFWAKTGDYNAQVEAYRNDVKRFDGKIEDNKNEIEKLKNSHFYSFPTTVEMKNANYLKPNDICYTKGFHAIGDNGSAYYLISSDCCSCNDMDILKCSNNQSAQLIIEDSKVDIMQLGALPDGSTICNPFITRGFEIASTLTLSIGIYKINKTVTVPSGKNLIGNYDINNTGSGARLNCVGYDITAIKTGGINSLIKNINIIHSYTNTQPVVDFSDARYLVMENIFLLRDDNTQKCKCVGFYCNPTNWSGYITLDNIRAANYKNCLWVKSTLLGCYNSVFNQSTEENLHLEGEIFEFTNCDISGTGIAFTYNSVYSLDFNGCYFEGFYVPFYEANNTRIHFNACKYYVSRTQEGTNVYQTTKNDTAPDVFNEYLNGFHSSTNLIKNGNFESGTTFYTTALQTEITDDAPEGFKKSCTLTGANASLIQNLDKKLSQGQYTLSFWYKCEQIPTTGYVTFTVWERIGSGGYSVLSLRLNSTTIKQGWNKVVTRLTVDEGHADIIGIAAIYKTTDTPIKVTGLSLHPGAYDEDDTYGNSCNETHVFTNALTIKGDDGRYYDISVSNNQIKVTPKS